MVEENPFTTAGSEPATSTEAAVKPVEETKEASKPSGRRVINEDTIEDSNWVNLPKKDEVGKFTPVLKIEEYYNQDGKTVSGADGPFYTGLKSENNTVEAGEFIVEGMVDGNKTKLRLNNWECVYKMGALVRHCKTHNFTLKNQEISFERVNEGQKNAGKNWVLHVGSLKIKIEGEKSEVVKL